MIKLGPRIFKNGGGSGNVAVLYGLRADDTILYFIRRLVLILEFKQAAFN